MGAARSLRWGDRDLTSTRPPSIAAVWNWSELPLQPVVSPQLHPLRSSHQVSFSTAAAAAAAAEFSLTGDEDWTEA